MRVLAGCIAFTCCLLFLGVGCRVPASAPLQGRPDKARQVAHRLAAAAAEEYEQRQALAPEGIEGRVVGLLQKLVAAQGGGPISVDQASQAMAREIGLGLRPAGHPPSALVTFAMRSHGLVEPHPHLVVAEAPPGSEEEMLQVLSQKLPRLLRGHRFNRAGVAVNTSRLTPGRRRLLIALLESRVRLDPIPRQIRAGQGARLVVYPTGGWKDFKLVKTDPGGRVHSAPLSTGAGAGAAITCAARGVYQVEITARGRYGVEVLANFPLYCGRAPPKEVTYGTAAAKLGPVAEMEQELHRLTNERRRRAGLSPLSYSRDLARVARRHSADMREHGFVGHVSPRWGRPLDRVGRAGLDFALVRENVARGYTVEEIIHGLMNSPAHRANILGKDVTAEGVGIVLDHSGLVPVLLLTQDFIKRLKPHNPVTALQEALQIIRAQRAATAKPPLKVDGDLTRLARDYIATLTGPGADAEGRAEAALDRALGQGIGRFSSVTTVQLKLPTLDMLAQEEVILGSGYSHLGISVGRQAKARAVVVLLLLGRTSVGEMPRAPTIWPAP